MNKRAVEEKLGTENINIKQKQNNVVLNHPNKLPMYQRQRLLMYLSMVKRNKKEHTYLTICSRIEKIRSLKNVKGVE